MRKIDNAAMNKYTTYKVGGIVKTMYFPENKEELINLLKEIKSSGEKYFIIGNGSNLIVDDNYFGGVIINLKDINKYEINGNNVYAECGVMLPVIAMKTINESLKGLECIVSVPGTIGGSIYNNAGAYNGELADVIKSVEVLDENLNIKTLTKEECNFSYRDSIFKQTKKYIILSCEMTLEKFNKEELLNLVEDRKQRRIASQPLEYPSAGSVFRNPTGLSTGKLIDDLGLKGTVVGGASISEKHGNFIVNLGNATSDDIKELIKLMKEKVKEKYDIDLVLEQEIINWE